MLNGCRMTSKKAGLMYTSIMLRDLHQKAHLNLQVLLEHCLTLSGQELNREIPGFGYPTVRLQLHHEIGAEEYWVSVLKGDIIVDENDSDYPTVPSLQAYRKKVFEATEAYLNGTMENDLNTPRSVMTWRKKELLVIPAYVIMRTLTHLYHHQGQITAMCRILDKSIAGLDFPVSPVEGNLFP